MDEPEYLPDKDGLHIIYDDLEVVNRNKQQWLERFAGIFRSVADEGGAG